MQDKCIPPILLLPFVNLFQNNGLRFVIIVIVVFVVIIVIVVIVVIIVIVVIVAIVVIVVMLKIKDLKSGRISCDNFSSVSKCSACFVLALCCDHLVD